LSNAFTSAKARFVLLNKNNPLVVKDTNPPQVAWLSHNDIADVIENPYTKGDALPHYNLLEEEPFVIFLGMNGAKERGSEAIPYFAVDVTPRGNLQAPYEQWHKRKKHRKVGYAA
jgi:NADH pyrophosphatase-like rudimentary NUDIX domain